MFLKSHPQNVAPLEFSPFSKGCYSEPFEFDGVYLAEITLWTEQVFNSIIIEDFIIKIKFTNYYFNNENEYFFKIPVLFLVIF